MAKTTIAIAILSVLDLATIMLVPLMDLTAMLNTFMCYKTVFFVKWILKLSNLVNGING